MKGLPILPNDGKCPCCNVGLLGLDNYGEGAPVGSSKCCNWLSETAIYVCSHCKAGITYVRNYFHDWELTRASILGSQKDKDGRQREVDRVYETRWDCCIAAG